MENEKLTVPYIVYESAMDRAERVIDEYIHSERDRKILKRRLIDGICFEPLSWEFDLSVRQTKSIVYRLEKRIFKHLTKG